MIITRTPFRISFFGGGTDYPIWYRENRGVVISTTIDKYCYINCRYLPPFFNYRYRIRYTTREEVQHVEEIVHPSVRECIKFLGLEKGIEMIHTSDIPAQSGIGSSSSFTVGFLNSLYALKGKIVTKRQLATDAINIEQNIIKENVGSQDQIAAAYGGFNRIEFKKLNEDRSEFDVHPITIGKEKLLDLQNHLMLFFTGHSRNASDIAREQIKRTPTMKNELNSMLEIVDQAIDVLNRRNSDIIDFGKLLHKSWEIKRHLTNKITNEDIDHIYESALESGALGGKLLGAGGGGCILFFVEPDIQHKVREKLKNLLYIPFKFENLGSQIIHYEPREEF